jgi:hypothetical protein
MAVGNIIQLKVTGAAHGKVCHNIFWYRHGSGSTVNVAAILANAFDNLYTEDMLDLMSEDAGIAGIEVQNYQLPTDAAIDTTNQGPGTVASEGAPSQWAVGVSMGRYAAGYNYPRKDLFGFPLFAFSGNDIDAGIKSVVTAIMNSVRQITVGADVFDWITFRPLGSFAIGAPGVSEFHSVGTVVRIFDGSRRSRRN